MIKVSNMFKMSYSSLHDVFSDHIGRQKILKLFRTATPDVLKSQLS